jgi:hypothetical protein
MMKSAVELFAEYRRDHQAALEPCIHCLVERCPDEEREQLDALLDSFYSDEYRRPPYSPVQTRRIHEKLEPIFEQAMSEPSVIAALDQRDAAWRDKPIWRKMWARGRFRLYCWRLRLALFGRAKPWE